MIRLNSVWRTPRRTTTGVTLGLPEQRAPSAGCSTRRCPVCPSVTHVSPYRRSPACPTDRRTDSSDASEKAATFGISTPITAGNETIVVDRQCKDQTHETISTREKTRIKIFGLLSYSQVISSDWIENTILRIQSIRSYIMRE